MYRDAWLKIDLDAFKDNIKTIIERSNKKLIAIIKADAYGCGSKTIYKAALEAGVSMFGVSSLEEALILRDAGCTADILILGYVGSENIDIVKENDFTLTTVSIEWIQEFVKNDCSNIKIQIKIDTGLNRIGLKGKEELKEALNLLENANFKIEGIFTHFACSDKDYGVKTKMQYESFLEILNSVNYDFKWIHCSNSDASMNLIDNVSNATRVGISLYGLNTYQKDLKIVVSLLCKMIHVKTVNKGETISYGADYTCEKDEIIATVPIGYADGWNKKNKDRSVYVEDCEAKIVGRVCMDQMMIKLEKFKPVGTLVELFGNNLPIEKVAKELDTTPYEVLTVLSDRLTRVYFENGEYLLNINPRLNRGEKI